MRKTQLITLFLILFCVSSKAQSSEAPRIGCKDATLLVQSIGLRESLIKQGFEVLNDAMLSMDSKDNFPIVVRMQAGLFYQIIFIGNTRSKRMNLVLYDGEKVAVLNKEQQPLNQTSNVVSFSFAPAVSADYTFMLSQTMKQELFKPKESVCGSFTILRLKKTVK